MFHIYVKCKYMTVIWNNGIGGPPSAKTADPITSASGVTGSSLRP